MVAIGGVGPALAASRGPSSRDDDSELLFLRCAAISRSRFWYALEPLRYHDVGHLADGWGHANAADSIAERLRAELVGEPTEELVEEAARSAADAHEVEDQLAVHLRQHGRELAAKAQRRWAAAGVHAGLGDVDAAGLFDALGLDVDERPIAAREPQACRIARGSDAGPRTSTRLGGNGRRSSLRRPRRRELREERVRTQIVVGLAGDAHGIVKAARACAGAPDEGRGVELVATNVSFLARVHDSMDEARDGEQLAELRDDLGDVFELQRVVPRLEGAWSLEEDAIAASGRQEDEMPRLVLRGTTRAREHDAAPLELLVVVERPWIRQPLPGQLADALLVDRFEVADSDGELAAHEVEKHPADQFAVAGARVGEDWMGVAPFVLRAAELAEGQVVDVEQTALLEVGRRDAPAAAQVALDPHQAFIVETLEATPELMAPASSSARG